MFTVMDTLNKQCIVWVFELNCLNTFTTSWEFAPKITILGWCDPEFTIKGTVIFVGNVDTVRGSKPFHCSIDLNLAVRVNRNTGQDDDGGVASS